MPFSSGAFPFFKSISCANSSSLVISSSPPSDVYSSSLLSSISSISSSITLSDVPSSKSLKCRLQLPNCTLSSILSFFFLYLLICFHAFSSVLIDFILSSSSFSYLSLDFASFPVFPPFIHIFFPFDPSSSQLSKFSS